MTRLAFGGGRGRRGQALMVAVLVLFAVATLAALFTAIIGSQLTQVARHSDAVALRNIAEAGLWLANEQLTYSLQGADWRPRSDPYRFAGGEMTITVSYDPRPDDLQSRFMRVVSTAIFPDNPFLRHTMVALKPLLLTDYARFITDRFVTNRPASFGVEGVELGGRPRDAYDPYVLLVDGPIRSNTHLVAYGLSRIYLHTANDLAEGTDTWRTLGILRDDRIEIAGDLIPDPLHPTDVRGGDALALIIDGDLRATDLFLPQTQDEAQDYAESFRDWWVPSALRGATSRLLANMPGYATVGGWERGPSLAVPRIEPPDIHAVHPDTLRGRYWLLTRESGTWAVDPETDAEENTGEFGWGWTNFGGIYVDNPTEIQYGHDLDLLQRNWLASVGRHYAEAAGRGDEREDADPPWDPDDGPPVGPADWWDKTGRHYAPPGVEIILHGEADCPYIEIVRHDDPDRDGKYWRQPDGEPTDLYDYPSPAGFCQPTAGPLPIGISGAVARFPFPPNGVIYVEGNVRVRGIMPPMRDMQGRAENRLPYIPYLDDDWASGAGRSRRFDLQVVSGGTIYIEGDLLTPRSAGEMEDSYFFDRYFGARLALLARDSVCVNTTALNPRPVKLQVAVPDPEDPEDLPYYYNDLQEEDLYPPAGSYPRYLTFHGPPSLTGPFVASPVTAYPNLRDSANTAMDFGYYNVRLANEILRGGISDLRLMIGHSGLYRTTPGAVTAAVPTEAGASVAVTLNINGTAYPWNGAGSYKFIVGSPGADESAHWYLDTDQQEFLPVAGIQEMQTLADLTGSDTFSFTATVTPVPDQDGEAWVVAPDQLGYLLGPLAIAPPRDRDPLPVRIEAMIYAQNGSWFVIPGPWFNEDPDGVETELQDYPGYHEPLNIQISVYGAITENMPADLAAATEWTSKWGGPALVDAEQEAFSFLTYEYDPLLRWPRWEPQSKTWAPRFPNLPVTPEMIIWGERVSGQAGG